MKKNKKRNDPILNASSEAVRIMKEAFTQYNNGLEKMLEEIEKKKEGTIIED